MLVASHGAVFAAYQTISDENAFVQSVLYSPAGTWGFRVADDFALAGGPAAFIDVLRDCYPISIDTSVAEFLAGIALVHNPPEPR